MPSAGPAEDRGLRAAWARGLAPPELATVAAWAEAERHWGTRGTGGRYRFTLVPFWREPADALSEGSGVERVVVQKASRLGGTEALVANLLGYVIAVTGGDVLLILPTVEVGKRFMRESFQPMLDATPPLAARSRLPAGGRQALLVRSFTGGSLTVIGARSAAGLRQTGVRYVIGDDLDGAPPDVGREGSLVVLAEARARTYGVGRKLLFLSSPTETGHSLIQAELERTDQRVFEVPCPRCAHRQRLVLDQLRWEPGQPETARYECAACRAAIAEREKPAVLAAGVWRPTARGLPRRRGYHLSALYSPTAWFSWADVAREAEAAGRDPARARAFRQTILAEAIMETIESPAWTVLRDRQSTTPLGLVPIDGPAYLCGGVDVQRRRIELHVWGFGRRRRRWLVDVQHFEGDTLDDAPWTALRQALEQQWPAVDGRWRLPLEKVAVDYRHRPQMVEAFARTCPPGVVVLVQGMARIAGGAVVSTPRSVETTQTDGRRRQRRRRGLQVRDVNTGVLKVEFYGHLALTDPAAPGWITLPSVGDELCRQLVAETMVRKRRRGIEVEVWETTYANHALDAALYARVAAQLFGCWDRFTEADWTAREATLGITPLPAPSDPAPPDRPAPAGGDSTTRVLPRVTAAPHPGYRRSTFWERPRR
jgi:phage terminase large subunit GpA-like protein